MSRLRIPLVLVGALALTAFVAHRAGPDDPWEHTKHEKFFPKCQTCHPGALDPSAAMWPKAESCAECHDGKVEDRVNWKEPAAKPKGNLKFTHDRHAREIRDSLGADSTVACMQCHAEQGAKWMHVRRPVLRQCFDCHKIQIAALWGADTSHVNAPDSACATCHITLAEATELPEARIAAFPKPVSHNAKGFYPGTHHGELAEDTRDASGRKYEVAPSCQTCHARDFCVQCHVDAPERKPIQALALDRRSLAIEAELVAPASHEASVFQARHGRQSKKKDANCVTCHTQESCLTCHRSAPAVATVVHASGPGRGPGAQIERKKPETHVINWADRHAPVADANPSSCNGCHARSECLECHRPNPGGADGYHPAGFLVRHPSSAYNRQADCAECHNTMQFCTSCHVQSGFKSNNGILAGRFHNAQTSFRLGHGQAARQSLETCITCHAESDCLACHSAQGGRSFNPHGPNFDAERLRKKNPQTCSACHGRNIPGR